MDKALPARFSDLPVGRQRAIAGRFLQSVAAYAGGSYDSVEGQTSRQRAPSVIELGGEDDILTPYKRGKMTNLMRQQMRNAPISRTIDQQRRVNVVGLVGGKLTLTTPETKFNDIAAAWFNSEWAPSAEFTDGLHFNELLKLALSTKDNTGDLVLLFDDGTLADSGRIRAFESDEIGNLQESAFKARFGESGWKQSQGRVYDALGRAVGVIVSTCQRGRQEFDSDKAFVLTRDLAVDRRDCHWTFIKSNFRFNQGRGVSPTSSSVNTLTDIYEIVASETQSTKQNAKLFGQLVDSSDTPADSVVPPEYRPAEADPTGETAPEGADAEATDQDLADDAQPKVSFEQLDAIGAFYDIMPPKLKYELIDTKRPNLNVIPMIEFLSGNATGVLGMGRLFASLNPDQSFTQFRGAQCLAKPSFEEAQKDLERYICDWAARNALLWAARTGKLSVSFPDGWQNCFSWAWPEMPEVNSVDAQNAFKLEIANMATTYAEKFGPNWQAKLEQVALEKRFLEERGLIHPATQTVSGQVAAPSAADPAKQQAS